MIYGYARVTTATQDEGGQERQLKAGATKREKIIGITVDRPQVGKLMKRLAPSDVAMTRPLTGCRATRLTFWLSPARCSAQEAVSGH